MKLEPVVNLLLDKGRLMDFLLQRKECKMVILAVCSQSKFKCFVCTESATLPRRILVQVSWTGLRVEITSETGFVIPSLSHHPKGINSMK